MKKDILITGYSLRAPNCQNTKQFNEALLNGEDLTCDTPRYPKGYLGLPPRAGIIPDPGSFDESFFKYSVKQANSLDPAMRMLLETTHEALMTSGICIDDIKGCDRTGVYVGHGFSDFSSYNTRFDYAHAGPEIVNTAHSMAAHKISFFYDLKGPSMVVDTACSSSLVALNYACNDIENGIIDRAIVSGVSLTLDPNKNNAFKNFSMLSPDGRCFSFDERANGYCRSEGIVTVVIERSSIRGEMFGRAAIVGTGVNNDGFTKEGITYPNSSAQTALARQVLDNYSLNPADVLYIECHGTGTVAGDREELQGLCNVYDDNQELAIGSVKSNMGHAECASGLFGLVKSVMMIEGKMLFPNHDFQSTPHLPIKEGKFWVPTEASPYRHNVIQINNFGFGGTNAVAFLSNVDQYEVDYEVEYARPSTSVFGFTNKKEPMLVAPRQSFTAEQVEIANHIGFKHLCNSKGDWFQTRNRTPVDKVAFVFPGQGSHWQNMGKELYDQNDTFKSTIDRLSQFYPGLDELYKNGDKWFERGNSVFGIVSFQIAVTNILKNKGIGYDYLLGHSLGEIATAYAGGLLTEKQAMMVATVRCGLISQLDPHKCIISNVERTDFRFEDKSFSPGKDEVKWSFKGLMVVVGLESEKIQKLLDEHKLLQTVVACYNSPTGQTVSGPEHEVERLIELVEEEYPGTFVRKLETANVAYHSKLFGFYENYIHEKLKENVGDIEDRKLSDVKMLGTCGQNVHNLMYHVKNITSPVFFQKQIEQLPQNTLIIEMGPSSPMSTQIKRIRKDLILCNTLLLRNSDNLETMRDPMFALSLYGLTNKNACPVAQNTYHNFEDIWNHSTKYYIPTWEDYQVSTKPGTELVFDLNKEWRSLKDHVVDDHNLFPAMGYIYIIWKVAGGKPIRIKNYNIHEALIINADKLKFTVQMDNTSISVYYDEKKKVSAEYEFIESRENDLNLVHDTQTCTSSSQFYSWIRRNGYCYGESYRLLENVSKFKCDLKETKDWIAHMDACLHLLLQDQKFMAFPVGIEYLDIYCEVSDDLPRQLSYSNGELRTKAMTIGKVKMQPSLYVYKHNAKVYGQKWIELYSRVTTEELNEIMRFQASTYYGDDESLNLEHLRRVDAPSEADVVFGSITSDHLPQFKILDEKADDDNYIGPVFTWDRGDDESELYVYSKKVSPHTFVDSWEAVNVESTGDQVCMVGNGAVSFLKTLLKEYPNMRHVWASDVEDDELVLPLTQHRDGQQGLWIEEIVGSSNDTRPDEGGFYLKFERPGMLDSARWIHESKQKTHTVTCAALNFRDVMRAFGKLKETDMNVGFEFAGFDNESGKRVFGVGRKCIGTHCSPSYTYPTPQSITDAEAATIPVVYLTAYYALFEKARVKAGDTVLVHAGSGGVGQAVIQICQARNINVFTTCHKSKREWLKERFGLEDYQIGDSRSDAFVKTVMDGTNGVGVNCVINSLSGNLQIESVKCLRSCGSFCEIGKYDIMQNTPIGQALFERNISFHVIDLMPLLNDPSCFEMWDNYLSNGFAANEIAPLPHMVYHQKDTIQAFRDMSQAKHKGKIIVKFDDECVFENSYLTFNATTKHHMITGGLGGLALCLAVRLSERGVSNITLASRSQFPKNQWQLDRIREIESNGTNVTLIKADIGVGFPDTGVQYDVVWHAATVYDDVMFKDMTDELWDRVQRVKVQGYKNIRRQYPNAKIVNFSSIVSYLGNPGQTNYAWANGELDHVAYSDPLTTTIQFGAVDNVGFIGHDEKNLKILQNAASLSLVRINEMVDFVEQFAFQDSSPVFSCYGLAVKKNVKVDLSTWTELNTAELLVEVLGGTADSFVQASDVILDDQGLDSLSRVELANMVSAISVEIPAIHIGQMTIQTLTAKIKKQ